MSFFFHGIFKGEFATQTCLQGKFGEEIGSDQFGGCVMFHAPLPGADVVTGRIEHVEVKALLLSGVFTRVIHMSVGHSLFGIFYEQC